jgi:DNA-binding beta-propeller fold protein YncE
VQVAFGFGSGWVGNGPDDTVTRFDPASGASLRTIKTPGDGGGLVVADGAVWIASFLTNGVSKISPATNSVVGTIRLPSGSEPNGILWLDNYLWVTESGTSDVAVIRPS